MKKYLLILLMLLVAMPALAVEQTKDQFTTTLNNSIKDTTAGAVPPSTLKTLFTNLKDSVYFGVVSATTFTRYITITVPGTLATGNGTGLGGRCFEVLADYNGKNLYSVNATVNSAGTSGSANLFQIRNATDTQDMLSTRIMIDAGEATSATSATPAVINATYDDVATGEVVCVDIDQLNTTPPVGLTVVLGFR